MIFFICQFELLYSRLKCWWVETCYILLFRVSILAHSKIHFSSSKAQNFDGSTFLLNQKILLAVHFFQNSIKMFVFHRKIACTSGIHHAVAWVGGLVGSASWTWQIHAHNFICISPCLHSIRFFKRVNFQLKALSISRKDLQCTYLQWRRNYSYISFIRRFYSHCSLQGLIW